MADVTDLNSSLAVKVAGASSSGSETNFVNASSNGDLQTSDILNFAVVESLLSVGTSAIEVKVGASPLANRKSVQIQAQGANIVYGYSSSNQFFTLANGSTISLDLGPNVRVWVRRNGGLLNVNVAIAEFA